MSSSTSPSSKYRGAVVEDLQLAPAFCLPATASLSAALEAAYEREFDQLPVLNDNRRPIGYLDIKLLKRKFEQGLADPVRTFLSFSLITTNMSLQPPAYTLHRLHPQNDPVRKHTTLFLPFHPTASATGDSSKPSLTYEVIHPLTPLEDLERFFDRQALAAEARNLKRHASAAAAAAEGSDGDKETTPTPSSTFESSNANNGSKDAAGEWDDEAEGKGHEFALVTDLGRKWVLAVATRNDLDVSLHGLAVFVVLETVEPGGAGADTVGLLLCRRL
ncbi:hypothetical protein QFC22_001698 [Naganishia vaughanmartiniae]|uniref:Uncharacterized protein n=1 Tax=Naganishia vaughanmartiniae TaxID=1424756 RepID=A0ACC2XEM5_9TREE|nr:hypothetical protein QFC22_001698 [Naganishia vaughanmartiniae]